jgi:hypothetical protein
VAAGEQQLHTRREYRVLGLLWKIRSSEARNEFSERRGIGVLAVFLYGAYLLLVVVAMFGAVWFVGSGHFPPKTSSELLPGKDPTFKLSSE